MREIMLKFWGKYIESNEIEQEEMLDELPMFKNKDKIGFLKFATKSQIKSYFDDIISYFMVPPLKKVPSGKEKTTPKGYRKAKSGLKKLRGLSK